MAQSAVRRVARTVRDTAAGRIRQNAREVVNGGRFTCSCGGKTCPGTFRSLRAQKAHAAREGMAAAGRWTSKAARDAERRMGKSLSDSRKHAISWLESAGLKEWRKVPVRDKDGNPRTRKDGTPITREVPVDTDKARSRPHLAARPRLRDLRQAHRHDRDHEKTAEAERRHTAVADRHEARGRPVHADISRGRAADATHRLRTSWPVRPRPARPGPARTR